MPLFLLESTNGMPLFLLESTNGAPIPTRKHERISAFLRESTNRQAFRCRIFAANMPPLSAGADRHGQAGRGPAGISGEGAAVTT